MIPCVGFLLFFQPSCPASKGAAAAVGGFFYLFFLSAFLVVGYAIYRAHELRQVVSMPGTIHGSSTAICRVPNGGGVCIGKTGCGLMRAHIRSRVPQSDSNAETGAEEKGNQPRAHPSPYCGQSQGAGK